MTWTMLDTWIVAAALLAAVSCALLGNFLLLRRLSMMGDAISHAVLPGIAVAFLLTQTRSGWAMLIGAAIVGILTTAFTQWIHGFGKVDESASMGVVFTSLFAVGLILIVRAADSVDLDPGCVLYGAIELVPLDTIRLAGFEIPRAVATLCIVFLINALFVILFYKELRISAFDPALATTLGINAHVMHYLLMTLVAVTTVACFESIGSILVIAMLIVPAAAAHLLTDRLLTMVLLSLVIAAASAALGHVAAITVPGWFGFTDTSTAGSMAVAAGAIFTLTLLLAPRHGVVSKLVHRGLLSLRITQEDILGLLYRLNERNIEASTKAIRSMLRDAMGSSPVLGAVALWTLQRRGRMDRSGGLTAAGQFEATGLVRSHRLWESYVARHFGLPVDHLHLPAARVEHYISGAMREAIARDVDDATHDPHGHPIPRPDQPAGQEEKEKETTP